MPNRFANRPVTLRVFAAVLALIPLLPSCGDDGGTDITPPPGPAPVAQVTVAAPATTVEVGQTLQLTATARDAAGNVLDDRTFNWATSDAALASVSSSGLVSGLAAGPVQISATAEEVEGRLTITVTSTPVPPPATVTPALQEVATGLTFPLYVASPPGDSRLFVVQKGGVIRVIKDGAVLDAPFLDITGKVMSTAGESGLLGLAFFPDYASSGRFLVHYSDFSGASRISLFRASADPDRADPTESLVLEVTRPGQAHFGGQLVFGPDGMLYIGLGDGDDSDGGRGQSLADLLGSILRIDVTSASPYVVPADNPFVATAGARPEVWSYGLRNPWRFSFDPANGDLYIGEVGESQWEEVNYSSAGDGAGRGVNYGWSRMEGRHCSRAGCDQTGISLPVLEYSHDEGCSVTGGYVYRGAALTGHEGKYFYADFCRGWVHSLRMEAGVAVDGTDWPALAPGGQITSFGKDDAGELYLTTRQGGVYKIVPQ